MKEENHHILLFLVASLLVLGVLHLQKVEARKDCNEVAGNRVTETVDLASLPLDSAEDLKAYNDLFYEICLHSKGY